MRKTLLATAAAAAVVGFTTLAAAQAPEGDKGAARPQGTQQQPKTAPGGAMTHQQSGAKPAEKTLGPQGGQSTQNQGAKQGAKTQDHVGQTQDKGVDPQDKAASQRGEESGKSGANANEKNANEKNANEKNANQAPASRGGSVQLSQDQRTRMHAAIGHDDGARFRGNVNFDVTVGAAVPRNVNVVVLPEDIVEIVPQYEGFDYILVNDDILIVDPRTLEIVAIIPA
jgi:hypothetical protein